jgi:VWFA-related protein
MTRTPPWDQRSESRQPRAGGAEAPRGLKPAPLGLILLLASLSAAAQVKFEATSQLVVVNVAVNAKSGEPLAGLTASDFTITEDDKPQQIRVFEYQSLDATPLDPPGLKARPTSAPQASAASTRIAPSRAGEVKYKDRRLLVLFFDRAGMPVADQLRAQQAALRFLRTQLTASDVVAVMTFATELTVLQDFTADRDRLIDVVTAIPIGDTGMSNGSTGASSEGDSSSAYSADDSEFNIFNTDRKLAALESAAKTLSSLPEKKALVYFASGMTRTGLDNQAQLRATINAAVRGNVAFYPVDARGLIATAPIGDATQASPGGQGMYSGDSQRNAQENLQGQQETLYTLAADTGGKALLDNNDLAEGVVQAQQAVSSYYILGYYSTNPALDGRFRRIKVQLAKNLTARLDYRSGYFAAKTFRKFSDSDKERQLQEALLLGDPVTDLTLAAEVNFFRQARDRYFVPVSVKIPGADIELARKGGAERARLDFIGQVTDAKGAIQGVVRDEITVKLKGEKAGQLSGRYLEYDAAFALPPGSYTLKFLARENETGKMGTFETAFVVPDLTADLRRLPISSVVLSHQREKLDDALGSAERHKKLLAANPLIQENQKLVPSVTRVFRKEHELYVYLEAYQPGADKAQPMLASVGFYRAGAKAFETAPFPIAGSLNAKSKAAPVSLSVPLAKLEPGRYICQVTVVNPAARKFAVWRSPIALLP